MMDSDNNGCQFAIIMTLWSAHVIHLLIMSRGIFQYLLKCNGFTAQHGSRHKSLMVILASFSSGVVARVAFCFCVRVFVCVACCLM